MPDQLRIGIVAGEKSGDILGAGLIKALRELRPDVGFIGIGGKDMVAVGCESVAPMERLSVMGFVEPIGRLPELFAIKRQLLSLFANNPPVCFIGIDSPEFNLRLEAALKRLGIPTVHYVSPSVWAYRHRRILRIRTAVDLMLTLFPFETAIYEEHGVQVRCVGHPLADQIGLEDRRNEHRKQYGLAIDEPVVALLPGSRTSEIVRLAPIFFSAAMEVIDKLPRLRFLIPSSGVEARDCIENQLLAAGVSGQERFTLVEDSRAAMSAADLVLLASGTATLEAMLLRRPMVVCYRLARLTYALASRMVKVPHIALPNLLSGQRLVPEYIQSDVTCENLCREIISFFEGSGVNTELMARFELLHLSLRKDASMTAARAIEGLLAQSP
ncbi:MAG: lipid-A-disaccharide synthase [Gammaproteobacteria bacterium]|nr:lipid-A-disaccharide synthase [Gammaproteobacteria bacterium]MCY4357630.1 lipid-A-disaccharide synthase [Gammaproteobacteria bacterium]